MICDFAHEGSGVANLRADVCVAGAGAAGITLAIECERQGLTVLLVEGGGEHPDIASAELLRTEPGSRPYDSPQIGRVRAIGGATNLWAGQMLPLQASDFQTRDWVRWSGWPISAEDVKPYYRRVETEHALPAASDDTRRWPAGLSPPPPLDSHHFVSRYSVFVRAPRFAALYGDHLRQSSAITVLMHANVTCINDRGDGRSADSFEIRSLSGRVATVRAHQFVIACGGIDTPRLLLASPPGRPGQPWNPHDNIGRYYHDHAHVSVHLAPADNSSFRRTFNSKRINGVRHLPKVMASPQLQRREQILAVGVDVCYDHGEASPITALKTIATMHRDRTARRHAPAAMFSLLRRPTDIARLVHATQRLKQKPSEAVGQPLLSVQTESPPDPENRVTLGDYTDPLGVPLARVEWRIDDRTVMTIRRYVELLADEFARHRVAAVDQSGLFAPGAHEFLASRINPGHHHMGATRMAADPRHGVVDANATIHGVTNLHIASTSIFPASGFSNPTFTMLALTLRLADHLKRLRDL